MSVSYTVPKRDGCTLEYVIIGRAAEFYVSLLIPYHGDMYSIISLSCLFSIFYSPFLQFSY